MELQGKHIEVWKSCLGLIGGIIDERKFRTWFSPVVPLSLDNSTLTLEVPSDFFREMLETEYIDVIKSALRKVLGNDARLIYSIHPVKGAEGIKVPSTGDELRPENRPVTMAARKDTVMNPFIIPGLKKIVIDPRLNPVYSFENLVRGECNNLAANAGENISASPGKTPFNPLFIFGGPGLGKTHIAQAVGNRIHRISPDLVVLYMTGNEFKTKFMDSVGINNKLTDFMAFFSRIDVLIVDDIQDLLGQGSQNAFFNIFNYLHQNGRQLIFTSDRSPVELQNFEERLLSRFKWGLSVELRRPDYTTRLEMLRSRCAREGFDMPAGILEYLAGRINTNFRELEGILVSIIAHATLAHMDVTEELAKQITDNLMSDTHTELTVKAVKEAVCEYFSIDIDTLQSASRKRQTVQARQIAMYLCRNHIAGISLSSIGAEIGGKDHATVLHACNTVSDLISTDRSFKHYVTEIEKMIVPVA